MGSLLINLLIYKALTIDAIRFRVHASRRKTVCTTGIEGWARASGRPPDPPFQTTPPSQQQQRW